MRKKVLSIVLAMIMVIAMLPTVAFAADYTDTAGNWAESSIERWSDEGIVEGNPDGTFAPNNNLKRSEFAQTMTKLMKITDTADLSVYTDVDMDSWYVAALEGVVAKGIMKGTSATTLGPDKNLTREQMFVMIGRALGVEPAETCEKDIPDAETASDWSIGYINALVNMGVINGVDTAGDVAPLADIQRGQTMAVLDRLIGGYANEDGQTVEIVPNKITLIVADNVTVTGEAGELPIVVAGSAAKVDMEGVEGEATVQVQVSDVAIENAPVGTEIKTDETTTGVTANGIDVSGDADKDVTIPEPTPTTPSTPSTGGTGGSGTGGGIVPPTPSEQPEEEQTYRIVFDATYGYIKLKDHSGDGDTCNGGNETCWGGDNTCYGGENDETSGGYKWAYITVADQKGEFTLEEIGMDPDDAFVLTAPSTEDGFKATEAFAGWFIKGTKQEDITKATLSKDSGTKASDGVIEIVISAYWYKADGENETCNGGENNVAGNYTAGAVSPTAPHDIEG